ncbi:MAG TPA: TetR/AcrR family transcriptional regulator [Pirellulales bacterium]|nr:TetR/AcrR family transcriptional regulator [Pirellulales bacterium]
MPTGATAVAPSKVKWAHPPAQARSEETRARILDATETLLAKRRFEDISVGDIVRASKSSVGAFYARFPDKDALLGCLYERFRLEQAELTDAMFDPDRWKNQPLAAVLTTAIPFLVQLHRQRQGLLRAFAARACSDERFRKVWRQARHHAARRLKELVATRRREVGHPDPDLAVESGLSMVLCTVELKLQLGEIDEPEMDVLADELVRALVAYAGIRSK